MPSINDIESLAALMREDETTALMEIDPQQIDRDEDQPRRTFDQDELTLLAESMRAQGIIQPLVVSVHPADPDRYMLVAGERRLRAAVIAGLPLVPIIVRTLAPEQRLAMQLVENLDRSPLDILEESLAVVRLLSTFGKTAREVADMLGKSQTWVSLRKKIGEHSKSVDVFVAGGRTTDAETLAMLVDLERLNPERYGLFMLAERVARAEVRAALDDAKTGATDVQPRPGPALLPVPPPTVTPPFVLEAADQDDRPALLPTLEDDDGPLIPDSAWNGSQASPVPRASGASKPDPDHADDDDDVTEVPKAPPSKPESKRPTIVESKPQPAGRPLIEGYAEAECRKAEQAITKGWNLKVRAVLSGKAEEGELRISFRDLTDLKNLANCLS